MMHRTQISLESRHYEFLMGEARRLGVSAAEVVRRLVDEKMASTAPRRHAIEELAGIGASGDGRSVAVDHDRILYDEMQR